MVGGTVGEVVASRNPNFAVGDIAMGYGGWQDYAVVNGSVLRKLNPAAAPVSRTVISHQLMQFRRATAAVLGYEPDVKTPDAP